MKVGLCRCLHLMAMLPIQKAAGWAAVLGYFLFCFPQDAATEAQRTEVIHEDKQTYDGASAVCVTENGYMAVVPSASANTDLLSLFSAKQIDSGKFWIGLKKSGSETTYKWKDASITALQSDWKDFFETQSFPTNKDCVVISIPGGKWEAVSCADTYGYVCHQVPKEATTTSDPIGDSGGDETDAAFDQRTLSLYIVLPIFFFCYGGSCILYCSHKLYRSCKRKRRDKMLLTKMEVEEYEPDNKPKYHPQPKMIPPGGTVMPPPRPFSPTKRGVIAPAPYGIPPQRMAFTKPGPMPPPPPPAPERPVRTPVQNIRIPSPAKEDEKKQEMTQKAAPPAPPKRPPTPPDEDLYSRPQTTARDIDVEVKSPRPDSQSFPVAPAGPPRPLSVAEKKEARRAKLLNNALQEARDRRTKEGGDAPRARSAPTKEEEEDEPDKRRKKKDGPPGPEKSDEPTGDQWASRRDKRNQKYRDDPDSGDSSTNLLSDNSSSPEMLSRDPTSMSIQEILRMKVAARTSKRRAKKILSA